MLKKKNIAMAMAFTTVATSVAPAFANTSGVQNIEVSSGETEKIAKINEKLAEAEKIMYSADRKTTNSQGEYTVRYVKFEKNSLGETSQNVPVYRVERTSEAGKEIIKVVDRGHRKEFETRWNPTTNRNDIVEVTYDHDVKGNNLPEKLVAQITITTKTNVNEYNIDANLLFKSNGKYSEMGERLKEHFKKDQSKITKTETVADGNKTGKKLTVSGNTQSFILTVWGTPSVNTEDSAIGSLAGIDRCETAAQVSQEGWVDGSANTVVIAGWNGTPDALAATPLASALDAPILLTEKNKVNNFTKTEIDRLQARNVIIVGGESHVSNDVIKELEGMGLNVKRISGSDRTRTSFEIAKTLEEVVKTEGKKINDVYVAGGYNGEADALSIASHAGQVEQPILLIDKNRIADDVKIWIEKQNTRGTIIGGTYAVDKNVEQQLDKIVVDQAQRIDGANIQETNAAVINEFHKGSEGLLIAQDKVLVDALSAGPLAAKMNVPVVLGTNNITKSQETAIRSNVQVKDKELLSSKAFNIGHGVSRSVVKFIERIFTTKA
ncbi:MULTISPECIES: cell wall-binding repeat-containing protein [Romboutsia]|uniref:Cell surface protein n=1 Tax=Romboutsia hominis TaxID=1507512 RepID=A0A2P2BU82_9FIRM|nr:MULTISPECIES: cell wall-binding repeat-containing protein [Romboutsia]MDB8792710.1 cell wall-binding repeat-containing protein [Romboutsia sp. 1001216sp1]MDB8795485.1 cell wall-binding repeat-containing protein [Romboutsia sp. 1001216sp1]MDB8799298.1 cell wall-binding repeat-containing protein [Romboutsia sp. 1001216sp1]CEI73899.1 Cell surface protein [Romboutsia hominis]